MDRIELEKRQENAFKDAVLSQAEAASMDIIAKAGRRRAEALDKAHREREAVDYETVRSHMRLGMEKAFAGSEGEARRALLARRQTLVEEMFAEVETRLQAFTQGEEYDRWLAARAQRHTDLTGDAPLTLWLREEDMPKAKALEKLLPNSSAKADKGIRLGGLRVSDGHRLFDETLDAALEEEKAAFYESGRLRL